MYTVVPLGSVFDLKLVIWTSKTTGRYMYIVVSLGSVFDLKLFHTDFKLGLQVDTCIQ